jgi:hypothetical protein
MKVRQSLQRRLLLPMMLLRNKLLLPKSGGPQQEGITGRLEVEVVSGMLEVVTPSGMLEAATPSGMLVVILTGTPLPPLPLRILKSLPIQSGLVVVLGTTKRRSQTIR